MTSYRDRKRKAGSIFYFVIGIVFLVVAVKWGVPFFINLLAGPSSGKKISINQSSAIPPQMPVLSAVPEATNTATIRVEGFTDPNIKATLLVNDQESDNTTTDDKGAFSMQAKLTEGDNRISVKATNKDDKDSTSNVKVVKYDKTPPQITLDSPKDGTQFYGKNSQVVEFKGKVSKPEADVTVNGSFARVDSTGAFSQMFRLNEGENAIKIVAVDQAGNRTELNLTVNFSL